MSSLPNILKMLAIFYLDIPIPSQNKNKTNERILINCFHKFLAIFISVFPLLLLEKQTIPIYPSLFDLPLSSMEILTWLTPNGSTLTTIFPFLPVNFSEFDRKLIKIYPTRFSSEMIVSSKLSSYTKDMSIFFTKHYLLMTLQRSLRRSLRLNLVKL